MSTDSAQPNAGASVPVLAHPAGRRGLLRTAQGQTVPVQTYDRDGEVVVVVLTPGSPPADEELDPATLEYPSERGIVRLHGEAHAEDPMIIRFHAEGDPELIQRRAHVRVHTPQPVTIGTVAEPRRQHAFTIDVSGGGMLLSGAPGLAQGAAVAFEIALGDDPDRIRGVARVVRAHDDGRRALAFERITEAERQRVIRFVFSCMRASRAKTRGDLV